MWIYDRLYLILFLLYCVIDYAPSQVNHAVSVGYARHLVAWLFSLWPKDQRITKSYLNNIDASKVVGLFDLIQEAEHKDQFEKVIFL